MLSLPWAVAGTAAYFPMHHRDDFDSMSETTDAAAIFTALWRRKWLILAVAIAVAGATYLYYKRQPTVFSATTELNLASGSEEQSLLSGNQSKALDTHIVGNAATLITSQSITEQVHAQLRGPHGHFVHGKVRASVSSSSDIVTISTEASTAKSAARLADAYAQVYIQRQRSAYQRALRVAILSTHRQLRRIEAQSLAKTRGTGAKGADSTSASAVIQAANLSSKLGQLESELHAAGVQQVNPATPRGAELVAPSPKKTRSSPSWSDSRWRPSLRSHSSDSTGVCTAWRRSSTPSGRRCSPRCRASRIRSCA